MTDDDLQSRLDALGRAPTPDVDEVFADRLESNLRMMAAEPARLSLWEQILRPSVVVAALLAVAGVVFLATRSTATSDLEFAAVQGTSVSIPGRPDLSDGTAGQQLPEGARITVGPQGSASVGGVVLEAGTVAIVVNGVVEVVELPPEPAADTSTTTTTAAPVQADAATDTTTSVAPETTTTEAAPAPVDESSDEDRATATTTTTAAPIDEPEPEAVPDQEREADADGQPPETTTTAPPPVDPPTTTAAREAPTQPGATAPGPVVTLTISPGENGHAMLRWTVDGDTTDIAGWAVRRGRGDDGEIAAVLRRPEARRQRVALPDRNVAWVVVARNADGEVVARSNIVRAN